MNKLELYSTQVRRLLLVAEVTAADERSARDKAREEFRRRNYDLVDGGFRIEVKKLAPGLFECRVFDFYFMELLSFRERVRHFFYKIRTTRLINIGIVPELIVIE